MMDPFITDLNYIEKVPSLRKLSSIRLVLQLWKTVDISPAIHDQSWMYYSRYMELSDTDHFKTLVDCIIERVDTLEIPRGLIDKVEYLTRYVGLHLFEWINYMKNWNFDLNIHDILACTNWTFYGTVDEYTSVESLMRKFGHRFPDAAFYFCKENEAIKMLNEDLPSGIKEYSNNCEVRTFSDFLMKYFLFKSQQRLSEFSMLARNFKLTPILLYVYMNESDFRTISVNIRMTKVSVLERNSVAVEYFFSTLETEEKVQNIVNFFRLARYTDLFNPCQNPKIFQIAYFFYSQMQPNRKNDILSMNKDYILRSMLDHFSFQNQIVPTISSLWEILDGDYYCRILLWIAERLLEKRFVVFLLLNYIWHVTPEYMKRKFFDHVALCNAGILLIEKCSQLMIGEIMQEATIRERNKMYSFCEI